MEPDYQGTEAARVIARLRSLLGRLRATPAVQVPVDPPLPPPLSWLEELAVDGRDAATWIANARRRLYSPTAERIDQLNVRHGDLVRKTRAAADRVIAHEFTLLGSGPFIPVDPHRPSRDGYQPIDWYLDPVQRLRFPERIPIAEWNLLEMRPGLADVKFPWEMSRCQHWLPLAQAFRLTSEARYATEILNQHDDFMEANPIGLGVNWTCTMDVALRALNWAIAADVINDGDDGRTPLTAVYASIFAHGHFIERHLENKYEVTSNHFLSNVVGLYAVGVLFRDLPSGRRWLARCREWLETEMRVQVLDDGADYESSVPYHRLVTELFLSGWRLAECEGQPLSAAYRGKLETMVEFFEAVLRPGGLMPQIGDADDGRVQIASDYGQWCPQDGRHLVAAASAVLHRRPAVALDQWAEWEAAWWGASLPAETIVTQDVDRLFPDAGLAVIKHGSTCLLVTNARVGTNGFGNHKHNDLLSFEFVDRGIPLIVDPGSYVYTSNPAERNRFRATASHNTVVIDGVEQNEFKDEWLFRMFEKAKPQHLSFEVAGGKAAYRGSHDGYERLPSPVTHERSFTLDHHSATLAIEDRFTGPGRHRLQWHFHCAPGVEIGRHEDALSLAAAGQRWVLRSAPSLDPTITAGGYSPSYGVKLASQVIAFEITADLAARNNWQFTLERID